jgi:hypothetical protein
MPAFWKALKKSITGVDSSLAERGIPGTAIVNAVEETYWEVGTGSRRPILEFSLRITVPGRDPYEVIHRQEGNALVGTQLHVFVDPENEQNVLIDWEASDEAVRQQQLKLQMANVDLPPATATPRENLDYQLRKGYITQAQYEAILENNPDL